jgi:ribose-phosphate pyrophosphokinase
MDGQAKLGLVTGTSNVGFAKAVAKELGIGVTLHGVANRFSDGEIKVQLPDNIRGADVFIIQSIQPPGDNLLELLIMIDAAKRASAGRVTAVIPYFGYARQDRKDKPRTPITAKLIADLIVTAGADRVLFVDLHTDTIEGFFSARDIKVDKVLGIEEVFRYALRYLGTMGINLQDLVLGAPDVGATALIKKLTEGKINLRMVIIDKRRPKPNESEVTNVIGDVEGATVLFLDDMVDTAGTITNAAVALKEKGAKQIFAAATHPVLSGPAIERLQKSPIEKLFVSDTFPLSAEKQIEKIEVISLAKLVADAIFRTHHNESISALFQKPIQL